MRRYSSRQSVSFGRGDEAARRVQGIVMIILVALLAALLLIYFVAVRPGMTTHGDLQRQYRSAMQSELKSAINVSESLSRNGGWDGYISAAKVRSCVYAVDRIYADYLDAGGTRIAGFDDIESLLSAIDDQYIPALQEGGTRTGNVVTDIRNRLNAMMNAIRMI